MEWNPVDRCNTSVSLRALVRLTRLTAMFALSFAPLFGQTPGSDAVFRGSAARDGYYGTAQLPAFGGLLWRVQTEGPVRSTPTVAGNDVFVGSGDGALYAINRLTGEVRWRRETGSSIPSSPAVAGRTVFVTTLGGEIIGVDRATGRIRLRYRTKHDRPLPWGREGLDYFTSSPVVAGGVVIAGSGDGGVYAIDIATARPRWVFQTGGRVRASPAIADGTVFIGSYDGIFYAIDLATGRERWRHATEGARLNSAEFGYDRRSIQSSAAVVNGTVYFGSRDGALYALDQATGVRRWRVEHDDNSWAIASPAVASGTVFEASSDAQFFRALRASDGQQLWRAQSPANAWSSPAITGEMVVYGVGDYAQDKPGGVHVLDRATGRRLWSYATGGPILSSPVVADGVIMVGSDDGGVYALRASGPALRRAVYWDSLVAPLSYVRDHRQVRDYLEARRYDRLDRASLVTWLTERVADRVPSVVVFAMDYAPRAVIGAAADTVLLRRYLDAGGKIVWLGMPPALWPVNGEGHRPITDMDPARPSAILGVEHVGALFDNYGARVTPTGRRWGLSGWWRGSWAIAPAQGMTILAHDERGDAVAWTRNYGGSPGSGFVQVGRSVWDWDALQQLSTIAEYFPGEESKP